MLDTVINQVSRQRLADDLWELVNIPSPTLGEREAALRFAEMLRNCGAMVEVDETFPESPNIVGWLRGGRPGPILQLAGHIDHVDVAHPTPQRDDHVISGRGAADMKNGLAGILEITRLLHDFGDFPGQLLLTVYGRHEAPRGDFRGLLSLLERDVRGDAALVLEGPDEAAVIMAPGNCVWNLTLRRDGQTCHEMTDPDKGWELLRGLGNFLNLLALKHRHLRDAPSNYPLLPPESVFIGQVHYGDFYNRAPAACTLQGTRRWHPDKNFARIQEEFTAWLNELGLPPGIRLESELTFVGDAYKIDAAAPIVRSMIKAWRDVAGLELDVSGHTSVNDTCRLVTRGKIPAVSCGFDTATGHADYEFVRLDRVTLACRVALATALNYLQM